MPGFDVFYRCEPVSRLASVLLIAGAFYAGFVWLTTVRDVSTSRQFHSGHRHPVRVAPSTDTPARSMPPRRFRPTPERADVLPMILSVRPSGTVPAR